MPEGPVGHKVKRELKLKIGCKSGTAAKYVRVSTGT